MNSRAGLVSSVGMAVAALIVVTVLPAKAAVPAVAPDFTVHSWDSDDGLPIARFYALARTPDGYLWIGSEAGLVRFDGARFVTLTTNLVPALGNNHILSLLVDTNGDLWVGTAAGTLAVRTGEGFAAVAMDSRLNGAPISHMKLDAEGTVWFAAAGHGLVRRKGSGWENPVSTRGMPSGSGIASFVFGPEGSLWAHVGEVLFSLRDGVWERERFQFDPRASVYAIVADRGQEDCWLAVTAPNPLPQHGARIVKFPAGAAPEELAPYPWAQDSQRNRVTTMLQDRRGRLWVGTWVNGVFCWDAGQGWRQPRSEQATSWHPVDALTEDEDGLIWMVTRDGSLHRVAERKVTALALPANAGSSTITSACVRRDGSIWVGSDDAGVFRFQEGEFVQFTNGLASIHIGVLLEDGRTNLWVGTWQGLHRWDGVKFRPVLGADSPKFTVFALHEDTEGNIWGGSGERGLFRLAPDGAVRFYGHEAGLDEYWVRGITQDGEGRIYLAVWGRGLYRLAGEKFERFSVERWPIVRFVHGLYPDSDGGLWIATEGMGLLHFENGTFRQWTSMDGLPDTLLRAVAPDAEGHLWFSSNKGIFGCSRQALNNYQRGKSSPVLFWRVSVRDGLPGKLASGAGQPVAARSADGRLWFPNSHALAGFDPATVREGGRTLAPLIQQVLADGVAHEPHSGKELRLTSGARRLEFHYTCPDLRAPERLRFRYRLEGNDDDWLDAGGQRAAHYGRLPPGSYRFHVMAGGASSQWRESAEPLQLVIVPQWWERTSVRVAGMMLGLFVSGGTVWLVARARHRRKLARLEVQQVRESERRRIARDIHDDLGATLTRMLWLGEMSGSPQAAQVHMRNVATAAREMSQSLEAIVWAVRPENDSLRSLVTYLGRRMDELFEGTEMGYRFIAPQELPDRMVFAEARHNVFLACKEALTNALKHSNAGEVRLELNCTGRTCQVTITDDGFGFDLQATRRTGAAGLKNMRSRMEEIQGEFELHSEPGKGTTVRLRFPIPPPGAE